MSSSNRPLSPHLQIYRLPLTALLSVAHRGTGVVLAMGLLLLVYWLAALAGSEQSYARATALLGSWFGQLVLFGFTFSLFLHLGNGLRHLWWDIGRGFELESVDRSAWAAIIFAAVMTLAVWIAAFAARGN